MENYQKKLENASLFSGMIYNGCKMGSWCFGMESKKMYYSTCPDEQEFLRFFTMSGCMDYIFSDETKKNKPVFLSDDIGMIWVTDYIYHDNKPDLAIVIGPVFNSASSVRGIEDSLKNQNYSIRIRNNLIQILQKVPVVSVAMMYQYAAMLHYAVTEETMTTYDFEFQNPVQEFEYKTPEEESEFSSEQKVSVERQRTTEETLLQLIKEGNLDYKRIMGERAGAEVPDDYQGKVPQRDNKNTMLIFAALCSRAAMEGGLSPRTAKDMEIGYISMIERTKTITELMNISDRMVGDFVTRVHQCQSHPEISRSIQECCDYIQRNLLKPLKLSDIAKEIGYTEYYLTRKFYKEMGMRLADYIKDYRIELAKIWLLTTQKSIQDISEELYFGTRNYFSKVFREKVGITPGAYREQQSAAAGKEKG